MTLVIESFFTVWVFIELSTLVFLFILNIDTSSIKGSRLKYFVIQALASILIIIFFRLFIRNEYFIHSKDTLITLILAWKTGMAPVHNWFINLIIDVSWDRFFLISTLIKITPFFLISFFLSYFRYLVILVRAAIPVLAGVRQACFKKIIGLSSIFTSSWVLRAILVGGVLWVASFITYGLLLLLFCKLNRAAPIKELDIGVVKESNLDSVTIFLSLLRLRGVPPFSGFFLKLFIITRLLKRGVIYFRLILLLVSSFSIYIYLKLLFKYISIINLMYSTKIGSSEIFSLVVLNFVSALVILY